QTPDRCNLRQLGHRRLPTLVHRDVGVVGHSPVPTTSWEREPACSLDRREPVSERRGGLQQRVALPEQLHPSTFPSRMSPPPPPRRPGASQSHPARPPPPAGGA